jgi:DNA-binding NarL/FixJ family response regulator
MPVRILVVDDHDVIREGVRGIISRLRPQWEICGEASDGEQAVSEARRLAPDLVLLDITMSKMSGFEAAPKIAALGKSKILMFTMHRSIALANDAQTAGAQGYVNKSEAVRYLVSAIETVLAGGVFFGQPEPTPESTEKKHNPGISFSLSLQYV